MPNVLYIFTTVHFPWLLKMPNRWQRLRDLCGLNTKIEDSVQTIKYTHECFLENVPLLQN